MHLNSHGLAMQVKTPNVMYSVQISTVKCNEVYTQAQYDTILNSRLQGKVVMYCTIKQSYPELSALPILHSTPRKQFAGAPSSRNPRQNHNTIVLRMLLPLPKPPIIPPPLQINLFNLPIPLIQRPQ